MKDLLLTDDMDLQLTNGDLSVGDPNDQNVQLLAATSPGQWKESPTAGMGLVDLLNSERQEGTVRHFINRQLRADGAKSKKISFDGDNINIEASYEN